MSLTDVSNEELLASLPRGVRNRNPGNIEDGDFARSLPGYKGGDGRFAVFDRLDSGRAAQARLLGSYGERGINTVEGVVNRWAPRTENDTGSYVKFVSQRLGVDPRQPLDMRDERVLAALSDAMAEHENGVSLAAPANLSDVPDDELLASLGDARAASAGAPIEGQSRLVRETPAAAIPLKPKAPAVPMKAKPRSDEVLGFQKGALKPLDNSAIWLEEGLQKLGLDTEAINDFVGLPSAQEAAASRVPFLKKREAEGVVPGKIGEFVGNVVATLPLSRIPGGPLAQGAAGGALLSDDPTDGAQVAKDAAFGAVVSRVAAAGSDALQVGLRKFMSKAPALKDLPELTALKRGLYDQVEKSGFVFSPKSVKQLADDFGAQVRQKGGPKAAQLIPAADAFAARLAALARQKGGVSLAQLDQLRGDIYEGLIQKGGAEATQGYRLRQMIDGLMDASDAPFIREARKANTIWEKASDVAERVASGKLAAGRANSGENVVNAVRQKLSPMIDPMHSGQVKNLTPDEKALLEKIVVGDKASNALRKGSNVLRNKFVSGPLAILAGSGLGPWTGLAVMGGLEGSGQVLRKGAENYTKRQVSDLMKLISVGGSKEALARVPTRASQAAETAVSRYVRPALVAAGVPLLAAARPAPKKKPKK